jgi:uncharacterized membrane protein YdjX (TVP38/TMEM64 family)
MSMRLLFWFLGFSLCILLIWVIWGGHWAQWGDVNTVVGVLQGYGVSAGLAGALLLVLDLLLPIPGTVVISALGFIYGTLQGSAIAFAGLFCAGMIGYGLGRLCSLKTAIKFLGEKDFLRGKSLFERGGGWVVALSRALPILPEAISVTAGLLRMPLAAFMISLACGSLPMAVLFAWIGATGHERPWLTLTLSFAVPAVLWSAASMWRKNRTND